MAKKKKSTLPKRVAGVKIPKSVRKSPVGHVLASPMGQAIIVDSLVQVGRKLLAETKDVDKAALRRFADTSGAKLKKARKKAKTGALDVSEAGSNLSFAIGEAARSFLQALHSGPPEDSPEPHYETAWTVSDTPEPAPAAAPAPAKKKPVRSSTTARH